jgi:hypothetical protein
MELKESEIHFITEIYKNKISKSELALLSDFIFNWLQMFGVQIIQIFS